jgi:hypothetical protein
MVVTTLRLIVRDRRIAGTCGTPKNQSAASANSRAGAHIARCTANSRTRRGTQERSNNGALNCRILSGLLTGCSAHLLVGELATDGIINAEMLKTLACARK